MNDGGEKITNEYTKYIPMQSHQILTILERNSKHLKTIENKE